jgi:acylphosphatase
MSPRRDAADRATAGSAAAAGPGQRGKIRSVTMPPALSATVIESDQLVLRKARDTDREGIVKVFTDPEIRAHLGGPSESVEQFLDQAGTASTTAAAGQLRHRADRQTDRLVGILGLGRHKADRPGVHCLRSACREGRRNSGRHRRSISMLTNQRR